MSGRTTDIFENSLRWTRLCKKGSNFTCELYLIYSQQLKTISNFAFFQFKSTPKMDCEEFCSIYSWNFAIEINSQFQNFKEQNYNKINPTRNTNRSVGIRGLDVLGVAAAGISLFAPAVVGGIINVIWRFVRK